METHLNWGVPVALDLFLAALGAGAFMLAVMADLAGGRRNRLVSTIGAFIAPWPVICGVLLLVIDLGVPHRFWEMVLRRGEGLSLEFPFLMFKVGSTMSIGTWVLTIFVWVSLGYIAVTILAYPFRWAGYLKKLVGVIGLPFALLVTVYTGVLLSATPNPLWSNWVLPIVFVASAMVTGIASVILILALLRLANLVHEEDARIAGLEKLNSGMIVVQVLALVVFMILGIQTAAMRSVVGTGFGALWWGAVIILGLIVPFFYGAVAKIRKPEASLVVAALVLLGGFLLRYVILIAGQVA
ncbi:MAG: NrfD/PsrC family molybdoenzyme membrane anchor subunit [Planctomycetota bacterium]|jgi:formate-dependent nitrite reductase membrane component NrfD